MWRSCWPSGACTPITLRCGDGYSVTPRRWNYVCTRGSEQPATVGGSTRPTSGSRVSGCIYTALWTDSTGATIDFLLWAKRDAAAAERFLAKALSGATHPAPRVINTDKHAGYPPAIVSEAALERNCRHRPVQSSTMSLNRITGRSSAGLTPVSIFARFGELGVRSPATRRSI